jgi:hypothetical protein
MSSSPVDNKLEFLGRGFPNRYFAGPKASSDKMSSSPDDNKLEFFGRGLLNRNAAGPITSSDKILNIKVP